MAGPQLPARTAGTDSTKARAAKPVAVTLWLVIVALTLAELWMIAATLGRPTPDQWGFRGFEAALALSFGSVGALIAARRPDNRIGWLCLGLSVITAFQGIVDQYPVLAEAADPPLPFAEPARWVAAWIWAIPSAGLLTLLPLIFPDGRLLSSRWRLAVLLALAAMAVLVGSIVLSTRPFGPLPPTTNVTPYFERIGPRMAAGFVLYLVAAGVAATSVVLRYRRARGDERQQIKWVAYAGVMATIGAPLGFLPTFIGQVFFIGTAFFAASAIAVAVLRYRLYEIDLIINRTLVYGALSALLAGVYTASITLSQRLFVAITGERSDAAIVFTTLIVVSLFTPLKTRLQSIVDQRLKMIPPAEVVSAGAAAATSATPETPLSAATAGEALDLLARLVQLRDTGALTAAEFEATKATLLERVR